MRRPRRPSLVRWLLELPLRLLFALVTFIVRIIIVLRSLIPLRLLLILCALVPLAWIYLRRVDNVSAVILVAIAIVFAFVAGSLRSGR